MAAALLDIGRVGEWWEHKLAALAGVGYATAAVGRSSPAAIAGAVAVVVLAVAVAAFYVSVLNDITDRRADRRAGKHNRLEGRPGWVGPAALAASVAAGAAVALAAWHDEPAALSLYAATWLAFGLYSARPARLKERGLAGALADASGAHLFPNVLMAVVVGEACRQRPGVLWVVLVGLWSVALGLRGALWHQIGDAGADVRAGLRTFASRRPDSARELGVRLVFPLELAAFVAMLIVAGGFPALGLLAVYGVLLWRARLKGGRITLVGAADSYRIAMLAFYAVWWPLALLVAGTISRPATAWVLAAQLCLFAKLTATAAYDAAYWVYPRR